LRHTLLAGTAFSGAVFVGFLPQILVWKTIFDRFYIGVPLGPDYMLWKAPFLTEALFSSRHGLFSWSPILLAAALGFLVFVKREIRCYS
jgi:hypothetical protein